MTAQRLEAVGVKNATDRYEWDDGSDHDDVTTIYVEGGLHQGIQCIKFDYVKTGQPTRSSHGYSREGFTQMFEIDHLNNEHLESVEGYKSFTKGIQALQFRTNLRVSEMMGYANSEKFTLAVDGKKIIGFHGSAWKDLGTLGAYFIEILPTRLEPKGGEGGDEWNDTGDDGADHEGVTKVTVRCGYEGVQNIRFDYINKDGHVQEGPLHGSTPDEGFDLVPFEINHLEKEYLLSVDGYYDETSGVIQTLQFKTNMKISKQMGNGKRGTKFSLECNGMRIIWFHGYAKENLNSLGAYFTRLPHTKLELIGNSNGDHWDDGTFQGVRKVFVHYDESIRSITFEYENQGKVEAREHGLKAAAVGKDAEYVLDYPNEYITSVEGKFAKSNGYTYIRSLTIKTSKERTSPTLGNAVGENLFDFVLESKGCALVGFYGWCDYGVVHSIGAYSYPMPFVQDPAKLEAQGDDEGASSDNGGVDGG
ncbi:unnamed protein product [Microthlaspi erraticum]|uniref:Jacalin-type lectin domain-containing protein n=1 Tax=Microthlaspi erraticum TaxID=1685480 RepID=A0A6D2I0C1_9BRAS|nr:unnamed protein product [Microthlaspi erraticum]